MATATRTITASITSGSNTDLKPGKSATFGNITSDTGAVANGIVSSATLYISSFKTYAATEYLTVNFSGTNVGRTPVLSKNGNVHSNTFSLSNISNVLITSPVSSISLGVVATSGTGNKINFRSGCTIRLSITYSYPALSWEASINATQINNQVVLNWNTAPSYSGGSGNCTFSIHNGTSWVASGLAVSTRSYTLTPTAYGKNITYTVTANYSGLSVSKTVTFAASSPSLSWNNAAPTITENEDGTLTISWNAGIGSWGAAGTAVTYALYSAASSSSGGTLVGTYTGTSVTITAPAKDTYYYVTATYSSASATSGRNIYAAHRTVKRWDGSAWEECIVYCYQNGTWVECIPYIYNGSGWELLSH